MQRRSPFFFGRTFQLLVYESIVEVKPEGPPSSW
jgi:hypothetical protein